MFVGDSAGRLCLPRDDFLHVEPTRPAGTAARDPPVAAGASAILRPALHVLHVSHPALQNFQAARQKAERSARVMLPSWLSLSLFVFKDAKNFSPPLSRALMLISAVIFLSNNCASGIPNVQSPFRTEMGQKRSGKKQKTCQLYLKKK